MRSRLSRPETAVAGLASAVLAVGALSAVALDDRRDAAPATGPTATPSGRGETAAPAPTSTVAAEPSPRTPATASPAPEPVRSAPPGEEPAPAPTPGPRTPEQVAAAFFDAAVQGRDADALAVAEAQALSDLREYEAWESHRLTDCASEQGEVVCLFESDTTFLRVALAPDSTTGWRVLSVT